MSHSDIRSTAYHSVKWSAISAYAVRFIRFFVLLVLAALIPKSEFGLLGIATMVIMLTQNFSELGVGQALIWHRSEQEDEDPDLANDTGFVMVMGVNCLLIIGLFFAAPLVASFFDEPRATAVIQVLLLPMGLASLTIVPRSLMEKRMQFKRAVWPEVVPAIASGIISVFLAFLWRDVWALVAGQITSAGIRLLLYAWAARWIPHFRFDPALCRRLLLFSLPLLGASLIQVATGVIPPGIIGKMTGTVALGVYQFAGRIAAFPYQAIIFVVGRVTFPLFAHMRDEPEQLRSGACEALKLIMLVSAPVCIGLAAVIPAAELVVYRGKWWDLPAPLAFLMLRALQRSIGSVTGDLLKATGKSSILQWLYGLRLGVLVPACLVGAYYWGLNGATLGVLIASSVALVAELEVLTRHFGISTRAIFDAIKIPLGAACLSAMAASAVLSPMALGPTLMGLVLGIAAGALVYVGIILKHERRILRDLKRTLTG